MKNNLDTQYTELLETILEHGVEKADRTGTGTRSIFGYTIRHNMADGFPLLTTKKMYTKGIIAELIWFLRGDTNIKFLQDNNVHIWDGDYEKSGRTDGELGPIYGKQWRNWTATIAPYTHDHEENVISHLTQPIDQIQNLINDLKSNPDSRRLMVTAWNPGELDQMTLPPCHYGFQVYTRELTWEEQVQWVLKNTNVEMENLYIVEEIAKESTPKRAISLMWNQRSVDTFLGLPFNIASYGLLLKIIATTVNMVPDQLIGNLGDAHLYLDHLDQAKEQINREGYKLPKLYINTEFWPTESGECGIGPLHSDFGTLANNMQIEDFQIEGYQSHPSIKAHLSN